MLSTRFSGIAPQLTVTNGRPGRDRFALDGAGDQFLADAGFAFDQDRDVRRGGAAAERDHLVHRTSPRITRSANVTCFGLLLDPVTPPCKRLDLERARCRRRRAAPARRLDDEIGGPGPHRANR